MQEPRLEQTNHMSNHMSFILMTTTNSPMILKILLQETSNIPSKRVQQQFLQQQIPTFYTKQHTYILRDLIFLLPNSIEFLHICQITNGLHNFLIHSTTIVPYMCKRDIIVIIISKNELYKRRTINLLYILFFIVFEIELKFMPFSLSP